MGRCSQLLTERKSRRALSDAAPDNATQTDAELQ
jgi:hypothetical protein